MIKLRSLLKPAGILSVILLVIFLTLSCVPSPSQGGPVVLIRYSGETVNQIGDSRPATGFIYLVLTLQIENHGYGEFSTNPDRFFVTVNRINYDIALIPFPDQMKTFGLPDGQSTKGKLAFEVPETISSWGYEPGYGAYLERINISWIKEQATKT